MKIINPLYDHAFKYLMQNTRIAKKVLSTLLECDVVELVLEQQEIVAYDVSRAVKLHRLDFSAVIVDEQGQKQKVLIELQKSKLPTNSLRFRTYLGESYTKRETFINTLGKEEQRAYPIISIYILGYNVKDIPYLAVSIDNKITNTVTKEEITVISDFIDLLTHKMRIIQIRRLSDKRRSRLEQFLMLFNQAWVTSDRYILNLEEIPEAFDDIAKYLGAPVQDEAFRQQLKGEEEIDAIFRNQEAEMAKKDEIIVEAKKEVKEAREEAKEAKEEVKEAKEAKQKAEQAKQKAEQAKQKAEQALLQTAKTLLKRGMSISEIATITGLDEKTISKYT